MVVELLHRIVNVLQLYFGAKLRESAVQENFATVYQVGPAGWHAGTPGHGAAS